MNNEVKPDTQEEDEFTKLLYDFVNQSDIDTPEEEMPLKNNEEITEAPSVKTEIIAENDGTNDNSVQSERKEEILIPTEETIAQDIENASSLEDLIKSDPMTETTSQTTETIAQDIENANSLDDLIQLEPISQIIVSENETITENVENSSLKDNVVQSEGREEILIPTEEIVAQDAENAGLLDNLISEETTENKIQEENLDSLVTTSKSTNTENNIATGMQTENLDSFVTSSNNSIAENSDNNAGTPDETSEKIEQSAEENITSAGYKLRNEEQELATAVSGFIDGIKMLTTKKNQKLPNFDFEAEQLYPNYKPSVGKKIAKFMLDCWDIICKYDPASMKKLKKDATDEEYLTFAEELSDEELQFTIYSYIETLYNLENCEIIYNEKISELQKNRIKKELYDQYMALQQRKIIFIQKLKEKSFPIDEDRLINNYFHAAQKDADGAFKALTQNPATFAPIDFNKIKPRFFGLIKVTPDDGIKANRRIGNFIKRLKV